MIFYFDTSALVKLVVVEPDSDVVRGLFMQSSARMAHDIAFVEMHSAVSRLARTRSIDPDLVSETRGRIDPLWNLLDKIQVEPPLLREAARVTAEHPLAAYDSLHLSAALRVRDTVGDAEFEFVCFDAGLRRAGAAEGLTVSSS